MAEAKGLLSSSSENPNLPSQGEEIKPYHEVIEELINQTSKDGEGLWTFSAILDHWWLTGRKPETSGSSRSGGTMAGETTWEPMRVIHSTDPVTVANYGIGW